MRTPDPDLHEVPFSVGPTWDQTAGLAAQQRDLKAAGAEKVFSEQAHSADRASCHCIDFPPPLYGARELLQPRRFDP